MILELDKVSFKEALNNDNGRTSSKKIIGLLSSGVCLLLMVALVIFYFSHTGDALLILQFFDKIITVFGISAGLLGVKSIANAISSRHTVTAAYPPVAPEQPQQLTPSEHHIDEEQHKRPRKRKKPENKPADEYTRMVESEPSEEIDA